ncbi:hypothetical protein J6590_098239 [Homalodisca vitripennis]|nr:hypothetical protein J6590_098239 [Homalodisca vitripennis]
MVNFVARSGYLIFTFIHIFTKGSNKWDTELENMVGYTWMPLLQKRRPYVEYQTIPTAANQTLSYFSMQLLGLRKEHEARSDMHRQSEAYLYCQLPASHCIHKEQVYIKNRCLGSGHLYKKITDPVKFHPSQPEPVIPKLTPLSESTALDHTIMDHWLFDINTALLYSMPLLL